MIIEFDANRNKYWVCFPEEDIDDEDNDQLGIRVPASKLRHPTEEDRIIGEENRKKRI